MKIKAYTLLPFFIIACGGTIDAPTDSGKTSDAPSIIQTDAAGDSSDGNTDSEASTKETVCQFSADPADSVSCEQGSGFLWRTDASGTQPCIVYCPVGATCWDNADPTHMGHCVQVSP